MDLNGCLAFKNTFKREDLTRQYPYYLSPTFRALRRSNLAILHDIMYMRARSTLSFIDSLVLETSRPSQPFIFFIPTHTLSLQPPLVILTVSSQAFEFSYSSEGSIYEVSSALVTYNSIPFSFELLSTTGEESIPSSDASFFSAIIHFP